MCSIFTVNFLIFFFKFCQVLKKLYLCILNQLNMTKKQKLTRRLIVLDHQILRLAKIYLSKKVARENVNFHVRVGSIQSKLIREKKHIKTLI